MIFYFLFLFLIFLILNNADRAKDYFKRNQGCIALLELFLSPILGKTEKKGVAVWVVKAAAVLFLKWSIGGSSRWASKKLRDVSGLLEPRVDLQKHYFCMSSLDCSKLTDDSVVCRKYGILSLEWGLWPALTDCR